MKGSQLISLDRRAAPHNKPLNLTGRWSSQERNSAASSRLRREGRSWYSGDELDLLDLGSKAIPAGYGLIR